MAKGGTSIPAGGWMKGDFIPEQRIIYAKVGGKLVELSRDVLKATFNWKNITDGRLASLVGKEAGKFVKQVLSRR